MNRTKRVFYGFCCTECGYEWASQFGNESQAVDIIPHLQCNCEDAKLSHREVIKVTRVRDLPFQFFV